MSDSLIQNLYNSSKKIESLEVKIENLTKITSKLVDSLIETASDMDFKFGEVYNSINYLSKRIDSVEYKVGNLENYIINIKPKEQPKEATNASNKSEIMNILHDQYSPKKDKPKEEDVNPAIAVRNELKDKLKKYRMQADE